MCQLCSQAHSSNVAVMATVVSDSTSEREGGREVRKDRWTDRQTDSRKEKILSSETPINFFLNLWPKLDYELVISRFKSSHDSFLLELRMGSLPSELTYGLKWGRKNFQRKIRGRGMDTVDVNVQHNNNSRPSIIWPQRAIYIFLPLIHLSCR